MKYAPLFHTLHTTLPKKPVQFSSALRQGVFPPFTPGYGTKTSVSSGPLEVILFTRLCCLCVTKALREAGQAPEAKRPAAPLPHPWPHATLRPRKHTRSAATTVVRTYAVRLSNHTRTHSMGSKSGLLLEWMACKSGGVIPPGHPPSSKTKRHYANRQAPQQPRPHKQKAQTQHATAMQAKEFSQLHTTAKRARSTPHPTDATQTGKGHPCKHVSKTHQSSTALK
jgi:hypothetical protein